MKTNSILFLLVAILLAGCAPTYEWRLKNEPTTDAERRACAEHVEKVLAATPHSLAGHDQDWDDAIRAAENEARQTLCRPTLWEWKEYNVFSPHAEWTGRWKYFDQQPTH